jgi:hypothetical protein
MLKGTTPLDFISLPVFLTAEDIKYKPSNTGRKILFYETHDSEPTSKIRPKPESLCSRLTKFFYR